MGRPIVYCAICGKRLSEEDFAKGRAHVADNASYCTDCRIVPEPLAPAAPKAAPPRSPPTPPPVVPKPSGASSKSLPSATPRRAHAPVAEESSSMGLVIGLGVVVVAIIVVVLILLSSGGPPPPPPALPTTNAPPPRVPDPPRPPGPRPPPAEDDGQAAIRTLEAFASSSSDPQAVLDRCEELKPKLRGTPHLSRLEAVEARAIEARKLRDREKKLAMSLENVKNLRDFDKEFKKREEVENLLKAAAEIAGPRKVEIEAMLAEYRTAAEAFAAKPVPPAPAVPAPGTRLGPYPLDDGGMIKHWLVLGPYGNRSDRSGFQDHDLLKTETEHVPVLGKEYTTREGTKVRWFQAPPAGDRVAFRSIDGLDLGSKPAAPAIIFAACWISVEKDCEVKFRTLVDDCYLLWLDHKRIMKESGQNFTTPEVAHVVSLSAGPHLLLLKVGNVGSDNFGFRLRILGLSGEQVPGIRVWNQDPVMPKVLYAENFNQGAGGWAGGEVVPGGVEGTTALSISKGKGGVYLDRRFPERAGPTWTLRFKVRPSADLKYFEFLIWAGRNNSNFRYHLRNLKKDQWNQVEMKAADLNLEWNGKGATFEGEAIHGLRIYMDDDLPAGASVLMDDFEILE